MTRTSEMRMYLVNKRETLGLSMRETSRLLQMDFHYYYRIETGLITRVSFISLCNIALVLGIGLNDLFKMETIYQQSKGAVDL
ncbi:MAG: helix-turn-helix transcriptional regulator [Candidatus Cloacimonadaceae bacterium]